MIYGTYIIPQAPFLPLEVLNGYPLYKYSAYVWKRADRRLYLIRPNYHDCISDYPGISARLKAPPGLVIDHQVVPLAVLHDIDHPSRCQLATIYEFDLPATSAESAILDIVLDGMRYMLRPTELTRQCHLVETTLFGLDSAMLDTFIRYYVECHGVDCFLLYYSGRLSAISDLVNDLCARNYEADIYLHEWDLPYWQTFCQKDDIELTWKHSAQSVQLAHASILAHYDARYLLNVDIDEYIDPSRPIGQILGASAEVYYFKEVRTRCGGRLCRGDGGRSLPNLLDAIRDGDKQPSSEPEGKFIQRTLGRARFFRIVHYPVPAIEPVVDAGVYYHLQCDSPYGQFYSRPRRGCLAGTPSQ
jgi:hypothetical protein